MADDRCTCCPYGYHIDLDFLKYLDSLYSGEKLRTIRRVRHSHVPASRSCDGFFSDDEVTRWRSYVGSTARSPLSPQSGGSGGNITTDEILLEIDTSMSKTLTSIEEVDSRVVRKKKPPRPLPDKARIQNGFGAKQTIVSESVQRETSTVTSAEMTSRVTDSASVDSSAQQLSGDISPAALQAIRDQLVVSLQRMRQLEDQVRVIPVMEEQLSLLREENSRLRKMLMASNATDGHVSSETEQLRTVRDSRGNIVVELPINVAKRELRSIGVGDNDIFGRPASGSIFTKFESSSSSRETRTEVHKTSSEARREFFKSCNEPDSGRMSSGWTSRITALKAVCSTGVGDGNVLDYDKMGLVQQHTTTVNQSAVNHAATSLQETRINLRVTVSEERNLSEPRWEVERFGTGRFQDVAVQCTIIGGVLSARWRRSADNTDLQSSLLSASVLQDENFNEDFIDEPPVTAMYRQQDAAVWDNKLAQLLKTEFDKLDEDNIVEETAISVNTQPSSFNWDGAFNRIDDGKTEPVSSDIVVEERTVSVDLQPTEFNWNDAFDKLEDSEVKKEELVTEASVLSVNAATEKSLELQPLLDRLETDSTEQADMQPFPPVLSPIRAYSGEELDFEEANDLPADDLVDVVHVDDQGQGQSEAAAAEAETGDSNKTEEVEETQNSQTENVNALLQSDICVDQTDVVIESQQTQTFIEAVVDTSSADKTEASTDVDIIQETTTEQVNNDLSCQQTEVTSDVHQATVTVSDDSPRTDDVLNDSLEETLLTQENSLESQQIKDSSEISEAATSDVGISEHVHVTNVVVVDETTTRSETSSASVDGVVEVSVTQTEVSSCNTADADEQSIETRDTNADHVIPPVSASDAVQSDDKTSGVAEETRDTNDVNVTNNETSTKGCRIIITETRIERQLISSETDHSQLAAAVDHSEQASNDQLQTVAAETDAQTEAVVTSLACRQEENIRPDLQTSDVTVTSAEYRQEDFRSDQRELVVNETGEEVQTSEQWSEMSEEMLTACAVYAQWLIDSSKVSLETKKSSVEVIQKNWFQTAARKSSSAAEVKLYLTAFERIHLPLLFAVVNMADNDMNTVLHFAVSYGNMGVIETLLDTGVCDIRRQNCAGYTPVMLAALLIIDIDQNRDIIKRLFSIGDVNVRSSVSGQTALMLAASHGRQEMVELLLECGADVNARDNDGSTALMCACEHGYMDIVQTLLAHPQCDSTLTDVDGSTALSIAMEEGYRDIGVLLYAHMNAGRQASPLEAEPDNVTE